ncbi:tyrosine-type recombinase/integrase [Ruminococcus albus]|uniref:Site-specific recombinase XerD n=1 Tax=Ruminococcus albus TaxID=1264 RepID=A0A1I1RFA0_RUMAL|nr:tyrosine-type recombinase/integrase [Ruminococcus albus]SFD18516.1 Site-specific recombinase XerD [Ruminococcus albus]SFD33031.1 Site-specific recombinase XerD [Ruminococcus albus]
MINDKEFLKFEEGFFKPYFEKFIEFKRGKGEKVAHSTMIRLRKLNNSLNSYHENLISTKMVEELLAPHDGLSELERQYIVSNLRQFCSFVALLGVDAVDVPRKYMRTVKSEFRPYIFSDTELQRLVNAADTLPTARRSNTHKLVYPVLVRILIGTGMRIGETLALTRDDVDPLNGIIHVINGKNGVSRYIPVSESLKKIIWDYAKNIDMAYGNKPFFTSSYTGGHLTYDAMKYMFPKMFKVAGICTASGKTPNIHSIRHTFCTRSLEKMLKSGMDIYTAIPILAAYVGHVNYLDTEKYIHFTEQDHEYLLQKESSLRSLFPEVKI